MDRRRFNNYLTIVSIVVIILQSLSCNQNKSKTTVNQVFNDYSVDSLMSEVEYAKGFDIYTVGHLKKLVIYNPQNLDKVLNTYYLTDSEYFHTYQPSAKLLQLPLDSVAVFSATQLNAFSKLHLIDRVIAVSESNYIHNKQVVNRLHNGSIVELAGNGNFYLEKTFEVNPSVIFYSPYNFSQKHPLAATKITMIPFFDFMESDPIGRAEWIKFTALFFNKSKEANIIFDTIVSQYNNYKKLAKNVTYKPTVFSDKYFGGQWFVPGGRSYIAQLFKDAGADYLWENNTSKGSVNLDFEVVFAKAADADYWRIVGNYPNGFTYDKLTAENELYANFKAFKEHNVIFCDSKKTGYFETGTLEPQILLSDLILAFHPELLKNHKPKYYQHQVDLNSANSFK